MTKFIINNQTDAWQTDFNFLLKKQVPLEAGTFFEWLNILQVFLLAFVKRDFFGETFKLHEWARVWRFSVNKQSWELVIFESSYKKHLLASTQKLVQFWDIFKSHT